MIEYNIPLEDVFVADNRIRREFPKEKELKLCESLWNLGQLQPIVLQGDELVCGERRLRAMQRLCKDKELQQTLRETLGEPHSGIIQAIEKGTIKFVQHEQLSEQQKLEAEIEENTRRLDLTWQEEAAATKRLHELRQKQYGVGGRGRGVQGWTKKATADEIVGRPANAAEQSAVSNKLLLAEYLDDPMIAVAKDEKEALQLLKKQSKAARRHQAALSVAQSDLKHTVVHGDCYTLLPTLEKGSFDVCIADPPYGREMHKHKFDGRQHTYDDSKDAFDKFCQTFPATIMPLMKEQAHLYVFCDFRNFQTLLIAFSITGWKVRQWPIIWDKGNVGTFGASETDPRHCYDCILYAHRGKKPLTAMYKDVINIQQDTSLVHAAGKPPSLYEDLIRRSCIAGDRLIDPMVGGGTFFTACTALSVHGVGIEKDEEAYQLAKLSAAGIDHHEVVKEDEDE